MRHSSTQSLIVKTYAHNGLVIDVSFTGEAFFNATAVAKHFGKEPKDWLKTDSTKEYIEAIRTEILIDENQLVIVKSGSPENGGGTWLHPKLAVAFARWCDVRFAVWCDGQIEVILKGAVASAPETPRPRKIKEAFGSGLSIAKLCGFTGNQALLSADRFTINSTGVSALKMIGATHLISETQVLHFTPTELGQRIEVSAKAFNKLLQERGLQDREGDRWVPTTAGQPYAMMLDTGKRHSDGTPVEQIKWSADVIGIVSRTPVE